MKKVFELPNFTVFLSGLGSLVVRKSLIKPLTCFSGMKLKKPQDIIIPFQWVTITLVQKNYVKLSMIIANLTTTSDKAPLNTFILKKTFLKRQKLNFFFNLIFLFIGTELNRKTSGMGSGRDHKPGLNLVRLKRNCTTFRNAAHKATGSVLDTFSVEIKERN